VTPIKKGSVSRAALHHLLLLLAKIVLGSEYLAAAVITVLPCAALLLLEGQARVRASLTVVLIVEEGCKLNAQEKISLTSWKLILLLQLSMKYSPKNFAMTAEGCRLPATLRRGAVAAS